MRLSWLSNAYSRPQISRAILTRKVTVIQFLVWRGSVSRSVRTTCEITSLYVQRLRFVPSWLTQNCIFTFWPRDPEKWARPGWIWNLVHLRCTFGDRRSVGLTCRYNTHVSFYDDLKPIKWVRVTWFLLYDQGSLVGLCVQDYKCLWAAVTICATLVPDRRTGRQTHRQHLTSLYE